MEEQSEAHPRQPVPNNSVGDLSAVRTLLELDPIIPLEVGECECCKGQPPLLISELP